MKKVFFATVAMAMFIMALTSCNNTPQENDTKSAVASISAELKIAYIEVDSIMSKYTFAVESQETLQKKAQNIQNTLTSKQQALEAAATKLQQDYQNNMLTQEQAQTRQTAIQNQSNDLQSLNQRLSTEFQTETEKFNTALSDSIQHYLAIYNKDKQYSMILSRMGDNILFADKKFDITDEVIAGLNKVYKPAKSDNSKTEDKAKK